MLYLIGLGLNEKGITLEGLEAVKKCKKIYLESYTVDFPYNTDKLEKVIGKKMSKLGREDVESDKLVKEAKKQDICLLVYGCPLFATTHMTLILECEKARVKWKVIYAASVFDAIAETGLQLYKFGKITSMPCWKKNFTPDSFLDCVIENGKLKAHSLILVDIGLPFNEALIQLEKAAANKDIDIDELLVCSSLGTSDSRIFTGDVEKLMKSKNQIKMPFCFIIPGDKHFMEDEAGKRFE